MRKTILLAVIACILGIVLLAMLAFCLPGRLGISTNMQESELFTGFAIAAKAPSSSGKEGKEGQRPGTSDGGNAVSGSPAGAGSNAAHDSASDAQTGAGSNAAHDSAAKVLPNSTLPGDADQHAGNKAEKETELTEQESSLPSSGKPLSEEGKAVALHQIIWSGDSRTLGLRDALKKADRLDDDLFTGKVGEGVRWFREEGMGELSDLIRDYPGVPVVLNFGVNDPQLIDEYVVAYWDVIRANPDTSIYILSVNPLDEEFLIGEGQVNEAVFDTVNSLNVARMNVKLKEEFGSRYIDTASWLKSDGFDTVDGLHYTTRTYLRIHDYVVKELFG